MLISPSLYCVLQILEVKSPIKLSKQDKNENLDCDKVAPVSRNTEQHTATAQPHHSVYAAVFNRISCMWLCFPGVPGWVGRAAQETDDTKRRSYPAAGELQDWHHHFLHILDGSDRADPQQRHGTKLECLWGVYSEALCMDSSHTEFRSGVLVDS